jgi:hypothetical protein
MYRKISVIISIAILAGCATPAYQQVMLIEKSDLNIKIEEKLKNKFYVRSVTGGKETNPLWVSEVDSETYKGALENSLAALGYRSFRPNSEYIIDVNLKDTKRPHIGLTMEINSEVDYFVTQKNGTISSFQISAIGSANISDEIFGVYRGKLANERAIKQNINKFVEAITNYLK